MKYVTRDGTGNISRLASAPQPGWSNVEALADDHADVLAYEAARALKRTPLERAKRRAQNDPLIVAVVKVMADLHGETLAQMRQRIVDKLV